MVGNLKIQDFKITILLYLFEDVIKSIVDAVLKLNRYTSGECEFLSLWKYWKHVSLREYSYINLTFERFST
jgi:hypothetical protein